MSKWWCYNCERKFDEPIEKVTTHEDSLGIQSMFANKVEIIETLCPYCGSCEIVNEDFTDMEEEDEE